MTKTQVNILAVTSFIVAAFFCIGTVLFCNEERTGAFILSAVFATGFTGLGFFILEKKNKDIRQENVSLKNNSKEQISKLNSETDKQNFKAQEQSPQSVIPKPPAEPPTPPKFANKEEYEKWKAEKMQQSKEASSSKISYNKIPLKSKGGVMTPKPLNEFGGWLRFFLALCEIRLVLNIVSFLSFLMNSSITGSIFDPNLLKYLKYLYIIFFIIGYLMRIVFLIWMIKTVEIRSANTPNKIIIILGLEVAVTLLPLILAITLLPSILGLTDSIGSLSVLSYIKSQLHIISGGSAFFVIWFFYFKKSKRVLYYYGKNACQRATTGKIL